MERLNMLKNLMSAKFEQSPDIRIMINIGALMDIPTGHYTFGKYGESILNGGLGQVTSVIGIGNNFKSTVLDYMMLSAASRLVETSQTDMQTYDSEISRHKSRMLALSKTFNQFKDKDIINDGTWGLTDKSIYSFNKWFDIVKDYCKEKVALKNKLIQDTPFLEKDGKTLMKVLPITFSSVDSLTESETDDVLKMKDDNELGESGANTLHMRSGGAKSRFLSELPIVTTPAYHFTLMTAHLGKDITIASGPMAPMPTKKLQYLKNGDSLKGVTNKFTFLMSNCWHSYNASPFINQSTKGPEYPLDSDDNVQGDTDFVKISIRNIRSKSGPSGYSLDLIASQTEGVLSELTEFNYLKDCDRYGISGTMQHYSLDLLPDVKLSRTSVRSKIKTEPKLTRVLNITSQMCQMEQFWKTIEENWLCTPKELYDGLIKKGYDWDILLNTRGWWTFDNDKHPVPFLSTKDLINMYHGNYHPYWLEEDKRTYKKGFHGN